MRRTWPCLTLALTAVASGAWRNQDVGAVPPPYGHAVEGPAGTWTIEGVGSDIWGTADQFHFLYHDAPMTGDFSVACRVVSFDHTPNPWGKAGLMARAPNTAGGALFMGPESYVLGAVTIAEGTCLQWRDGQGAEASWVDVRQWEGPNDRYLKLVREDATFALYAGPHPDVLQFVNSHTPAVISAGGPLYVGIAVCSHDRNHVARAVVDQINLNAPFMTTLAPAGFMARVAGPMVELSWTNGRTYTELALYREDIIGGGMVRLTPGPSASDEFFIDAPGDGVFRYWLTGRYLTHWRVAAQSVKAAVSSEPGVGHIGADGFFRSWVMLGPIVAPGAAPGLDALRHDYLDGAESAVLPQDGDAQVFHAPAIRGETDGWVGLNPGAPGIGQWFVHHAPGNTLDYLAILNGHNPDPATHLPNTHPAFINFMMYNVCYLENTSGASKVVAGCVSSDDAVVVMLGNTVLWAHNVARGYGDAGVVQDRFVFALPPGEHRLLVKIFQGGGAAGFRFRLEDVAGRPLTGSDGIVLRTAPAALASVPSAAATRILPVMVAGEDAVVTVAITGGPVDLIEIVPANVAIIDPSGGVVSGQEITWPNTGGPVAYTVRPTAAGGVFTGVARDLSNNAWLTVGGMTSALFPSRIGDWFSADFSSPGSPGLLPPVVEVVGTDVTISTYEGVDIWGTADEFHYLWKVFPAGKTVSVQARLDQFDPIPGANQPWSKAGVMFRTHPTRGSPHVYAMLRSDVEGGLPDRAWQWRDASGAEAAHDGAFYSDADDQMLPVWIRAIYSDGMVRGYFAPDAGGAPGVWTEMVPRALNLEGSDTIMAGLAVTTHVDDSPLPVTAYFSHVTAQEVCLPVTVTRTFEADAFVNFEGTPGALYTEGQPIAVVLTLGDIHACPGSGSVVIVEQLPMDWAADGITGGGVYDAGFGTITWTIPAVQLAAGRLRYTLSGEFNASYERVSGGVELSGLGMTTPIEGMNVLVSANGMDMNTGAVVSWLLLGPFIHRSPRGAHDIGIIRQDHLSDGTRFETTIRPRAGDEITPDYGGASAAVRLAPAANPAINPNVAAGAAEWFAWRSAYGSPVELTVPALYGPRDDAMLYSVCYLDVRVDELAVDIRAGSDDAVQILLNGEEIWANPVSRAWPGFADFAGVHRLGQGVHILMVKTFQGVGAWNFGVQLFLDNGWGPVSPHDLCVSLNPEGCDAPVPERVWVRVGDANGDGMVNIADAITVLGYLFGAQPKPPMPCLKAADANNDHAVNIADAITILSYLFARGEMRRPDGSPLAAGETPQCEGFDRALIPATIGGEPSCAAPCEKGVRPL